jgi:hypothetical protein
MAVPEGQRGERKLETLMKARDLATYTIRICVNPKVFLPQYQNALTDKIIDTATEIFIKCDSANNILIRSDFDKIELQNLINERKLLQEQACECCNRLLGLMQIAQPIFHLSTKRIKYWGGMTIEVRNHIRKWKESDRKRFNAYL